MTRSPALTSGNLPDPLTPHPRTTSRLNSTPPLIKSNFLAASHSQRIRAIHLRPEGGRLTIITPGVEDSTVEQLAINSKCDLFREIYGYEIVLSKA